MASVRLDLLEWQTHGPGHQGYLLAGVSLSDEPGLSALAATLTQREMLSVQDFRQGLEVSTTSWVGRVRLGDLVVTVRPKIPLPQLTTLLQYAYGLRRLHRFSDAGFVAESAGFLDLLLLQLTAEVGELLERGLHRRYVRTAEDLATPRGRIDFQGLARQRDVAAATLPCVHYPRSEDILINRVLLAGLRLGTHLASDTLLRGTLRRQAAVLADQVAEIPLDGQVFKLLSAQTDRLTAAYRPALAIIRLLAEGAGITLDDVAGLQGGARDHMALPGFLFDMNRFFQALLGRFLSEHLPGYTLLQEYQLRGIMSYIPEYNPQRRRAPAPRPDFAIAQGGRVIALLDAKYRDLWEQPLPRGMLYQLAIYALSQGSGGRSTILYPTMADGAREQRVSISHPSGGERAQVVLRPVHMRRLAELVADRGASGKHAARILLANEMAFGKMANDPLSGGGLPLERPGPRLGAGAYCG